MIRKVYTSVDDFKKQNNELGTDLLFSDNTEVLGTPMTLAGKTVPNRLVCQAMEGCDGTADGSPDTLTKRRYERFAKGGAGIIWFEATAVMEEGRANPRQLYINEDNIDNFKRQVEEIKETAMKNPSKRLGEIEDTVNAVLFLLSDKADYIIGNPPYIRLQNLSIEYRDYIKNNFVSATGRFDIFICFLEKSDELLNENGRMCLITSA